MPVPVFVVEKVGIETGINGTAGMGLKTFGELPVIPLLDPLPPLLLHFSEPFDPPFPPPFPLLLPRYRLLLDFLDPLLHALTGAIVGNGVGGGVGGSVIFL